MIARLPKAHVEVCLRAMNGWEADFMYYEESGQDPQLHLRDKFLLLVLINSYPIFRNFPARDFTTLQEIVLVNILDDLRLSHESQSRNWGKGLIQ
jgi:hypothetical protein